MKLSLSVCLIAFVATNVSSALAQMPPMTRGISVQMAHSTDAAAFPQADGADAWIITITSDGQLFFGVQPVAANSLADVMKARPRDRDANVYIKPDAGASFGYVRLALQAAHANYFETAVLLTAQSRSKNDGAVAPPRGLEVRLGVPSAPSVLIQLHRASGSTPEVRVNDREIPLPGMRGALAAALAGQQNKSVTLKSEDDLPSTYVVKVVDLCRSLGAITSLTID